MTGPSSEQIILQEGQSSELVSALQTVAETDVDGEPKFSRSICRDLAKAIACRSYAPSFLELCHLVRIGDAFGGGIGYEQFFWGSGPARPGGFRNFIRRSLDTVGSPATDFAVTESAIDISYPDGNFTITFARMPFLSAVMEFLISTIGYGELDDLLRSMLVPEISKRSVSRQANRLSKLLYDYLKEHLPTAQTQRKFRRLIAFMEEYAGAAFEAACIDDPAVLDFWIAESVKRSANGIDFKTFHSVFMAFVRLCQSLEHAGDLHALDNPKAIGTDRLADEVDPDGISAMVESADEYRSPLDALRQQPAKAIKFLNRRETASVEILFDCGRMALSLPLSLMRCEVFGKAQRRLTQALREKVDGSELEAIIEDCAPETYVERKKGFQRISDHIGRLLLASLHVLVRNKHGDAISLLMKVRPELDFEPLGRLLQIGDGAAGNVVNLRAGPLADRFLSVIEDAGKVGAEISALTAEARKAFHGLSRRGFAAGDPELLDGFVAGSRVLPEIEKQLSSFIERLDRMALPRSDWDKQFEADKGIFATQFHLLYGGIH